MAFGEQVSSATEKYTKMIKVRLFGVNNERLDFVMDSFYKLSPTQRNGVFALGVGIISVFILSAFVLYFSEVRALEAELSDSVASLQELKRMRVRDNDEEKRFSKLVETIDSKTRGLAFKPFFEKLTKEKNVVMKDLNEKEIDFESSNPLADSIREVHIDLRLPQVSIPRLLNFIAEVEKSERYIRLKDIKITGQYGNKLYFDTSLMFRGYVSKK